MILSQDPSNVQKRFDDFGPKTPPPVHRLKINGCIDDMVLNLSPSISFDDSPPSSPSKKNSQDNVDNDISISNRTFSEVTNQLSNQQHQELYHENQNPSLDNTDDNQSDGEPFVIARKLLRIRHVRKERLRKQRENECQSNRDEKKRKTDEETETICNDMLKLLSRAVAREKLSSNLTHDSYEDILGIDDVTSRQKNFNKMFSSSYGPVNMNERSCDSPLVKRRLKFNGNNWSEGPTISPLRHNHNLMVGKFYGRR